MKKTDSYNKYVPLFIDNYAEQRSAKLRARMGWAGYGIYLAILQRLRSEKDCVLELDYETLAFSFWTDEDTLRSIIEDFGLFTIDRQREHELWASRAVSHEVAKRLYAEALALCDNDPDRAIEYLKTLDIRR